MQNLGNQRRRNQNDIDNHRHGQEFVGEIIRAKIDGMGDEGDMVAQPLKPAPKVILKGDYNPGEYTQGDIVHVEINKGERTYMFGEIVNPDDRMDDEVAMPGDFTEETLDKIMDARKKFIDEKNLDSDQEEALQDFVTWMAFQMR